MDKAQVIKPGVLVYSSPRITSGCVASLNKGEEVTVLDQEEWWYMIESHNHSDTIVGWIHDSDLKFLDDESPECKCYYTELILVALLLPVIAMAIIFVRDRLIR